MKYELNFGCDVITLPGKVLTERLHQCKEIELKALIALASDAELRSDFEAGAEALCQRLACDRAALDTAIAFWRGAGVVLTSKEASSVKNPKSRRRSNAPTYTGQELASIIEDENLSMIINELQKILKRTFNPTEANTVVSLMRYLNVDADYLMLLCRYCSEIGNPSMRYIETTAYSLFDEGITNSQLLDAYIKSKAEINSFFGMVRSIIGIGGRALSKSEKTTFEKWASEFGYSEEIIRLAYDITVEKTGKYSIRYLDKVLTNWHLSGLNTIEEINKYIENAQNKPEKSDNKSFETDEFFEAALRRSYESKIERPKDK
ncbi:MAG: DnaD domain protein [Clostridia bacterium]|nr:DnaD domain protein [Clostridia bacterium]